MKVLSEHNGKVTVQNNCPFCGKSEIKKFDQEGFDDWSSGELIQNAMPNVSPSDREFLITGICDKCFPSEG